MRFYIVCRLFGLLLGVLSIACSTGGHRNLDGDGPLVLSGFLNPDTPYVFTRRQILSIVPEEKLRGFDSRFVAYAYPDYAGESSDSVNYYNGIASVSGLFGFCFSGTRDDTTYVLGVVLRNGKFVALTQTPRSVPFEGAGSNCCDKYILGDAGVERMGADCLALVSDRYQAIRTDTAPHSLFSIYANVIAADTVIVCR